MLKRYDIETKILTIPYNCHYNYSIPKDTLKIIGYNQEIKKNVLPTSLTHLTFSDRFNKEIKKMYYHQI
jgi:uncharacterized protein (DUF1015 family)